MAKEHQLHTLGDLLGSLTYFGQCPTCNRQHMSSHDRVYVDPTHSHVIYCDRCPPKGDK